VYLFDPKYSKKERFEIFLLFKITVFQKSFNQLPEEIRCAKTLAAFKSRLKTHLFSCAFAE